MFGGGLAYVAMTWQLLESNESVTAVAILMACFWLPNTLIGPLCGVVVDSYNRKVLLIIANASRAILLLIFWLVSQQTFSVGLIYGLALLIGCVIALYMPAALALIREIVDEKELLYANASIDMAYEMGAVAGMGFAGLIIAMTSLQMCFLINSACFAVATLGLLRVKIAKVKSEHRSTQGGIWHEFMLGWQYLAKRKRLMRVYSIQMLYFVCYMTAPILLAPYAKTILQTNVAEFGRIEAALSVGIILGGVITPFLSEKYGVFRMMWLESMVCAFAFFAFSHVSDLWWADLWYFIIGFCFSAWAVIMTQSQELTDLNFQGRVQSIFNSLSGVFILSIYFILFLAGDWIGLARLYWFEIGLMLVSSMLLLGLIRRKSS